MRRDENTDEEISSFGSDSEEFRNAKLPVAIKATTTTLVLVLISTLAFSAVARVDKVVTSDRGKIVPVGGTVLLQPLELSLIKSIDVREGEKVKKGQLLATLDPTFATADVEQLDNQAASLKAQIDRLSAEKSGEVYVPKLNNSDEDKYGLLQKSLFDQRSMQFKAQMESFEQKVQQTKASIVRLTGDEARYLEREKISQQIEGMRQTLVEKQAGSYLNLLIANDARLEMLRTMENGRNSLNEARHMLAALSSDRDAFQQQWLSSVSQELITARQSYENIQAQLSKAQRKKELVRWTAPEDGIILSRAKASVGSVLREGEVLMTLASDTAPVEAELNISAQLVGFIRPGDFVSLKVDAFPFVEHGMAYGHLDWISEGAFSSDDEGRPVAPFYKARATITKRNFTRVPSTFRLIPGMTLVADIHIGQRSVLGYLVEGAIGTLNESMREP